MNIWVGISGGLFLIVILLIAFSIETHYDLKKTTKKSYDLEHRIKDLEEENEYLDEEINDLEDKNNTLESLIDELKKEENINLKNKGSKQEV